MTLRQEVERDLGIMNGDQPTAKSAPSAWRKTAKYWFILGVGFVLGSATAGALAVIVSLA